MYPLNKLIMGTVGVILFVQTSAQTLNPVSYPCMGISPQLASILTNTVQGLSCIEDVNNTTQPIEIDGSQQLTLKADEYIHFDGEVHIYGDNGFFHGLTEKAGISLAWFDPNGTAWESVPKYEKLELGVNFSQEVTDLIYDFIDFSQSSSIGVYGSVLDPNKPGLNPFDPEDIDLKAEFSYFISDQNGGGVWTDVSGGLPQVLTQSFEENDLFFPLKVNGFYYKEMEHNTTGFPVDWKWDDVDMVDAYNSDYNFRIRFAPPIIGTWKCKITATINGLPQVSFPEFTFECVNSPNKGYVQIGDNNRFFKLGGEPYFPVGRNIPHPQCNYAAATGDNFGCEDVKALTPYNWELGNENPAYTLSFLEEITDYHNYGGDYFRMLFFGEHYEIEFEKLNNYYERMHEAWDFDRVVDHCESLGVKIHLNLQNHEAFQRIGGFSEKYDWLNQLETHAWHDCGQQDPTDVGYCYHSELGIPTPTDFLTDPEGTKYYKHRLRYITSRWGYSTTISMMELRSEMNNHAGEKHCDTDTKIKPYANPIDDNFPELIFGWNGTMFDYLKTHQHFQHLTAVSYTGAPTIVKVSKNPDVYKSKIFHGDYSYYLNNVDVASFNFYSGNGLRTFEGVFKVFKDLNMLYDPNDNAIKHHLMNKPLIISETGNGNFKSCDQDVDYITGVWASAFTGTAMAAMDWHYQQRPELAVHLQRVRQFVDGIDFDGGADGPWKPQQQDRADKRASLFVLKSQENNKRAIGVIVNNTVNYYTMGDIGSDCREVDNKPSEDVHLIPVQVSPNDSNLVILHDMGGWKRYDVFYYNALTGVPLSPTIGKLTKSNGDLELEFPTLSSDMSGFVIKFKVVRHNESLFSPIVEDNEPLTLKAKLENQLSVTKVRGDNEEIDNSVLPDEEINIDFEIHLSPNPTTSKSILSISKNFTNVKVKILTPQLKIIEEVSLYNNSYLVNLDKQPSGVYLVVVSSEEGKFVHKLVKQ